MNSKLKIRMATFVLLAAVLACNTPFEQVLPPDDVQTAAALTLQAILTPSFTYDVIFTYLAGKKLEIVGRYDPGNFWLVKSPESPTGTCWLWGQYVEVTGSYLAVPSVTPPPTSTSAPPQAPSILEWNFSCSGGTMTFNVTWIDKANNETGYRVFRDGELAVELPANSTTYTDSIPLLAGESAEYYLQVYSPSGSANSSLMKMSC